MALALFALTGCSDDSAPMTPDTSNVIAVDPLDDVLKSTDGDTPEEPRPRIARLAEVLGLDETQAADLETAYLVFKDGVLALREQVRADELTFEEARAAAALLRDDFEAALQTILTEAQYDLLQEMRENRPDPRHHPRPHADRWEEWLVAIEADTAQVEAILTGLETLRSDMQELRASVRAGDLTLEDAKEDAMALRDAFNLLLQETLTEDQYAALLDLRPDCRDRD